MTEKCEHCQTLQENFDLVIEGMLIRSFGVRQTLENLLLACSGLPLTETQRMEKEIRAATSALGFQQKKGEPVSYQEVVLGHLEAALEILQAQPTPGPRDEDKK